MENEIIYWGPMGCLTGFYLILKGNRKPEELYDNWQSMSEIIAYDEERYNQQGI